MLKFLKEINQKIEEQCCNQIQIKLGKQTVEVGNDSKLISKILENFVIGILEKSCKEHGFKFKKNKFQNKYPDFIIYNNKNPIAIDIKTSYLRSTNIINGFTLGTYKGYFRNCKETKGTVLPYSQFKQHYCICLVYKRTKHLKIVHTFTREKWELASKVPGSGNTCNIGSIKNIKNILSNQSLFNSKKEFENYWKNYNC
jgi:hypothetical protein